mgnify:CR=1 FL=1
MTEHIRRLGLGKLVVSLIGVVAMVAIVTGAVAASSGTTAPSHFTSGSVRRPDPPSSSILHPDPLFPKYNSRMPSPVCCMLTLTRPLLIVTSEAAPVPRLSMAKRAGNSIAMAALRVTGGPAG